MYKYFRSQGYTVCIPILQVQVQVPDTSTGTSTAKIQSSDTIPTSRCSPSSTKTEVCKKQEKACPTLEKGCQKQEEVCQKLEKVCQKSEQVGQKLEKAHNQAFE